jgi:myo-inositol-1(or 4)-monophosphatase
VNIESFLRRKINEKYPGSAIIGEEMGKTGLLEDDKYSWYLDPIDGTINFVLGFPSFHIIIGIVKNGKPIFTACYNPIIKELCWAEKGKGAFIGNKRVHVSNVSTLHDAIFAFGSLRGTNDFRAIMDCYNDAFAGHLKRAVRTGSISSTVAALMNGKLDGNIADHYIPYDLGVLTLLVEEAGGKATGLDGKPLLLNLPINNPTVLSNGLLHKEALVYVKSFFKKSKKLNKNK